MASVRTISSASAISFDSFGSFMQLIWVLLIFLFVLAVTYAATRWIAGYQKVQSHNKNLKVIEILKITQNKYIQIIQAGDEYLVIAVGRDEIRLLAKLTEEQLVSLPQEGSLAGMETEHFQELFEKFKKQIKNRIPKK